jgi:hypothetical protein
MKKILFVEQSTGHRLFIGMRFNNWNADVMKEYLREDKDRLSTVLQ